MKQLTKDSSPNFTSSSRSSISKKKTKKNKAIRKWADDLKRHFPKDGRQIAYKPMKECSPSLIITERQIKTTMRYNLKPVRVPIIEKSTNNKCW